MIEKQSELYISVDVETSGPIPGEFSLLSLGACVVGHTDRTFYAELKPLSDNFVQAALEVNQLSMDELKRSGESPAEAMGRFEKWILNEADGKRPVFVAFNATFDWSFTHWYFIKFLGRDPFGISGLDIKAYYMGLKKTRWGQTTKKQIRATFTPGHRHTHNALEDAIEQAEIFAQMLEQQP
jgi:ribonuclease T